MVERLPWLRIMVWSLAGLLVTLVLLVQVFHRSGATLLNLVQPGQLGPSHRVFAKDFPGITLPNSVGHDGQQFYAIARQPMHPTAVGPDLGGNPRYRLQRIFFPVLAWALHPTGGGIGLVRAMIVVSLLAVFAGGVAAGALSVSLGGPAWAAMSFGLMPGVYAAARLTTADNLAMALVLSAIVLSLRRRSVWAVAAGVGAVLAREVSLVPMLGYAVWRRDRSMVAFVALPAAAEGAWFLALRKLFPGVAYGSDRSPFFRGVRAAAPYWSGPHGLGSLIVVIACIVVVGAVVVFRLGSPLALPAMLSFAVSLFVGAEAINLFYNLSRSVLPPMILAVLALVAPNATLQARQPSGGRPNGGRL